MERKDNVSKMVDLLRSGAVMLSEVCPVCHTPLFRLRSGDIYCATCEKKVLIVKEGEEEELKLLQLSVASELDRTIFQKLSELNDMIKREDDVDRLYELAKCLVAWLEALDKVKRLKELAS